jgi:outer membrane protein OmpA-like peptidoglycan-associated protein
MRALALLALCLPATALAGNPYDKYTGSVGEVSIDGVVELELLSGAYGGELPFIRVRFSEDDDTYWLFLLDMGGDEIIVSKTVAEEHGSGVKTKNKNFFGSLGKKKDEAAYKLGGKFEVTSFDQLLLGEGLVASDVTAMVGSFPVPSPILDDFAFASVAGVIGVGALDLPTALLPSEGVVRFAPADQGQAILDAVGGTVVPFESAESVKVKTWMGKQVLPGAYMVIDGEIAGQPVKLSPSTIVDASELRRSVEVGEVPTQPIADVQGVFVGVKIGQHELEPAWFVQRDLTTVEYPGGIVAALGYNILADYDIAVDPVSGQIALDVAKAQQRHWPIQGIIGARDKELEPEEAEEGEAKEKTEDDIKAEQEKRAGVLDQKAFFHIVAGEHEEAIAALEEATGLDAEPCERWFYLSTAYQHAHRFDDAAVAAQKAMDRYLAWSSLSSEEREEIQEMDDEEREASGVQPQDLDACYQMPGVIAHYQLVAGETDAAIATYTEHADLHPNIGLMAGIAYLLEDDDAAANGPLRQALNMGARSTGQYQGILNGARIALAELYQRNGDLDTALAHWERERNYLAHDPFAAQQYAELVRQRDGDAAALAAVQALADGMPLNPVAYTVLGNELSAAGQADAAKAAYDKAGELIDHAIALRPSVASGYGLEAWLAVQVEDWAGAKEAAQKGLELNATEGYSHWAMMKVAEVERKMPMALKHYKLAKSHNMGHYFFATLPAPQLKITAKAIKITEKALDIPEKVFFQTGSAVIDARSYELLDAIAQVLTEHPELLQVSVEGHTDSDGDDKANKKLSQERAAAVVAYLVAKGVTEDRLVAVGWGEEKPIAANDTPENKAANRRVEFLITKK